MDCGTQMDNSGIDCGIHRWIIVEWIIVDNGLWNTNGIQIVEWIVEYKWIIVEWIVEYKWIIVEWIQMDNYEYGLIMIVNCGLLVTIYGFRCACKIVMWEK